MDTRLTSLIVTGLLVLVTIGITVWAARRTRTSSDIYVAGSRVTANQNALAMVGDFAGASTLLGLTGLVYLVGYDGVVYVVVGLVGTLVIGVLVAERVKNLGILTIGDIFAIRFREGPARAAAAIVVVAICLIYLVANIVAAGALVGSLLDIPYAVAVLATSALMLIYVYFGGMLATTWIQVIKAVLLMVGVIAVAVFALKELGFDVGAMISSAVAHSHAGGTFLLSGALFPSTPDGVSFVLGSLLGFMGFPHILQRFLTVPDGAVARRSMTRAVALISALYALVILMGLAARAVLAPKEAGLVDAGGNLVLPELARHIGGGVGTFAGDLAYALIVGLACVTILAVVAGAMVAASGALGHDLWAKGIRGDAAGERERVLAAQVGAGALAVAAALISLYVQGMNVAVLTILGYTVAGSGMVPALLLMLTWRRMNTGGVVWGCVVGTVAAVGLILLGPHVWGPGHSPIGFELANPGIVSVPLGFAGCWLGSLRYRRGAEDRSPSIAVTRSELGTAADAADTADTGRAWTPPVTRVVRARLRDQLIVCVIPSVALFAVMIAGTAGPRALGARIIGDLNAGFLVMIALIVYVPLASWWYGRRALAYDAQIERSPQRAAEDGPVADVAP